MSSQRRINQVSAGTPASSLNQFDVDVIDLQNLEALISEQQQRDQENPDQEPEDPITQTQNAATAKMYIHRLRSQTDFPHSRKNVRNL